MSKGLGKLQQAILDYLKAQGKPCYATNIAYALYDGQDIPPRSFLVSVRRALHALAQQELVCCGNSPDHPGFRDYGHRSLICWLPAQPTPRLYPRISGVDAERLVLAALAHAEAETDPIERSFIFERVPLFFTDANKRLTRIEEHLVRYGWLTNKVVKGLGGNMINGAQAVAVHRAVKRLAAKGTIQAYRKGRSNRYGWVKLHPSYVLPCKEISLQGNT